MKKTLLILAIALLSCTAYAQDSSRMNRNDRMPSRDSLTHRDTTWKEKNWKNEPLPKDKRRPSRPDSTRRERPDSLNKQ